MSRAMTTIGKTAMRAAFAACTMMLLTAGSAATAAEGAPPLPQFDWRFDGPFGTFDLTSAQRGLQVYAEVCSTCHSLDLIYFRDLEGLGYTEEEIKGFAAQYQVPAVPNDEGEIVDRPALPSDRFPNPYPNVQAARAANGGASPPDLTLMIKARKGGADYVAAYLTGFEEPPEGFALPDGKYYNAYFPGHAVGMPDMLVDGAVTYEDRTEATPTQMARDLVNFLAWTAEPHMVERKHMGVKVLVFLLVFAGLLYVVKRSVWASAH
jgi:ubiquinol-cytochrome c reductase cytochrome c1 subunit